MTDTDKQVLKGLITTIATLNSGIKPLLQVPAPPALGGMPPMPINIQPSLGPLLHAIRMQLDLNDKLLKLLQEIIDRSPRTIQGPRGA